MGDVISAGSTPASGTKFKKTNKMANVKHNAYHVKLKLIPKQNGYKSSFVQGIVFAMTPTLAEKMAVEKWIDAVKKEPFEVEVKVHSSVRLRNDFMFHP